MIVERSSVPGLKDATRCAASEMLFNYPNCARINPNFAVTLAGFR